MLSMFGTNGEIVLVDVRCDLERVADNVAVAVALLVRDELSESLGDRESVIVNEGDREGVGVAVTRDRELLVDIVTLPDREALSDTLGERDVVTELVAVSDREGNNVKVREVVRLVDVEGVSDNVSLTVSEPVNVSEKDVELETGRVSLVYLEKVFDGVIIDDDKLMESVKETERESLTDADADGVSDWDEVSERDVLLDPELEWDGDSDTVEEREWERVVETVVDVLSDTEGDEVSLSDEDGDLLCVGDEVLE